MGLNAKTQGSFDRHLLAGLAALKPQVNSASCKPVS